MLFLIRSNQLVSDDNVLNIGKKEFGSGLNVYIMDVDKFVNIVIVLIGEEGRYHFLINIGHSLEKLKLDFSDRQGWVELLSQY